MLIVGHVLAAATGTGVLAAVKPHKHVPDPADQMQYLLLVQRDWSRVQQSFSWWMHDNEGACDDVYGIGTQYLRDMHAIFDEALAHWSSMHPLPSPYVLDGPWVVGMQQIMYCSEGFAVLA